MATLDLVRRFFAALAVAVLVVPIENAAAAEPYDITVMSRNIYLGSDVGVALDLLPDFPAAAQFMWDQVIATDFSKRAAKLADEAAKERPELIGIQEATTWYCKKYPWSKRVVVFDFLEDLIAATKLTGVGYSLATANGVSAYNPGYSIAAIPFLTKVRDTERFLPLFGSDEVACGFTIGDAILVRDDVAANVKQVGNTEYEASYSIVPTLMTIYRGYTWLDLQVRDSLVRVLSTHLESIWDEGEIPNSALQAEQLVSDLQGAEMPLIVMGDFNADPRDPRSATEPNPGLQPVQSDACPTAGASKCNAYQKMIEAGFTNSSPAANDPKYYTWGASALLDGPDPKRFEVAQRLGNQYGFTDRLDYIFTKNIYATVSSKLIGNVYPDGSSNWDCGTKRCFASDHAGLVATIELPRASSAQDQPLDRHQRFPLGFWHYVAIALVSFTSWRIARRFSRD